MGNLGKKSNTKTTTTATATGTGISRLLTNLQTLPKRKSLLVIETGFPTSLIDLFIKSTFSKEGHQKTKTKTKTRTETESGNSNKRKKRTPKSGPAIPPTSIRTDPPVAPAVVPPGMEAVADRRDSCEQSGGGIEFGGLADAVSGSNNNSVAFAVLKVFLAAVLALRTEKLTIGITMSAFLLLFLEYFGKRLSRFQPRIPPDLISESVASSSSSSPSCASADEIVTVGDSVVSGVEIHQVRQGSDVPNVSRRGGKLRSNIMKRLIPKKLHGGSKKGKGEEAEKCREVEVKPALPSSPPCGCEETIDQSKNADEPLQENAEDGGEVAAAAVKRLQRGKRGSGYLLSVLVLIVISGLLWGRILAFLLAIGWCLLLKFVDLFFKPPTSHFPPPLEA